MGRNTHRDAESVRRALEKQPAEQLHGEWAQFPRRFLETRATRTPVAVVERVDRLELRMHQRRLHER